MDADVEDARDLSVLGGQRPSLSAGRPTAFPVHDGQYGQ